jgi:hypothetical protein
MKRLGNTVTLAIITTFFFSCWVHSATVAQWPAEFSSIQGTGNWYYLYAINYDYNSEEIVNQLLWDSVDNCYEETTEGPTISSIGRVCPGNVYAPGLKHSAIVRWVSEVNADLHLSGTFQKIAGTEDDPVHIDGVIAFVRVNGIEKWSASIPGSDVANHSFDIIVPGVNVGDDVDFVIYSVYYYYWDTSGLSITISTATKAPIFSPPGPYISGPTAVDITSSTAGASIYYTIDGSIPTTNSTLCTGPITVTNGTTLKAIAVANGYDSSAVTSQTYSFLSAASPVGAITIYRETFSEGANTALNGMAPDVGTNTWIASPGLNTNSSKQAAVTGLKAAYLPFIPENGWIYSLSADIQEIPGGHFSCIGFAQYARTDGVTWHTSNVNPTGWMYSHTSGDGEMWAGPATTNLVSSYSGEGAGIHNLRIDLDTSGGTGNWTLAYYCDGVLEAGPVAFPTNGIINYVSFGGSYTQSTCIVDNFILTYRLPISRGRQVILNRGLQIQALVNPIVPPTGPDINLWLSANFTTFMPWHTSTDNNPSILAQLAAAGAQWSRESFISSYLASWELPYLDNFVTMQYQDELFQTPEVLASEKSSFATWNMLYSNALAYTNFSASNEVTMLHDYMQFTHPDMLMFDYYPSITFPENDRNTWYFEMQKFRTLGLEGNDGTGKKPIPYGQWLNLYRRNSAVGFPSESYVRLQQFASWAFGYTFIEAYMYNASGFDTVVPVMFDTNGEQTVVFDYVADANIESRRLGSALVRLLSTDVRMKVGEHYVGQEKVWDFWPLFYHWEDVYEPNSLPTDLLAWNTTVDPYITNISVTNLGPYNNGHPGDLLIGFFKPLHESFDGSSYSNQKYFMIVNGLINYTEDDSSAYYCRQAITIDFNFGTSGINSIQRMKRTDSNSDGIGDVETIIAGSSYDGLTFTSLGGNTYSMVLTLPGGTGDLFKYNTGAPFVGAN